MKKGYWVSQVKEIKNIVAEEAEKKSGNTDRK